MQDSLPTRRLARRRCQPLVQAGESAGEVAGDAGLSLVGPAAEEHHQRESPGCTREKVYQRVLMPPVDLSEIPFNLVAIHRAAAAPARRKTDQHGYTPCGRP